MASFGIASVLVVLLVASYVSNLEAARECFHDDECASKCPPGDAFFCHILTGKCICKPQRIIPMEDAKCSNDAGCANSCPPGDAFFCHIQTGKCICKPSIIPMEDAKCSNDAGCANSCPPGFKVHKCQHGICLCQRNA